MTQEELRLWIENKKLKDALSDLIPWAQSPPRNVPWATPAAIERNLEMCDAAIAQAWNCFPEVYDNGVSGANETIALYVGEGVTIKVDGFPIDGPYIVLANQGN